MASDEGQLLEATLFGLLAASERLTEGIFNDRRQRPSAFGGVLFGFVQQGLIQAYGGPHTSRHIASTSICQLPQSP